MELVRRSPSMWPQSFAAAASHRASPLHRLNRFQGRTAALPFPSWICSRPLGSPAMVDLNLDLDESDPPLVDDDGLVPSPVVASTMEVVPSAPSPQRSPPIWHVYDGVRVSLVERAAKRKAATAESSSSRGPSRCSGSSSRWKKARAKATAVTSLLELPLLATPTPLTRSKLKLIAKAAI